MRVEWIGEVRWKAGSWVACGRWPDNPPNFDDLKSKSWNVVSSRPRGTPYPVALRVVKVTFEPQPAMPWEEDPK